jgi:hypothetical protein
VGQRDCLVHAERGIEVLHPDRAVVFRAGLGEQPHPLIRRRAGTGGQFRLVDRGQLGVDPRRTAQVSLPGRVAGVQELAVQRLEVRPPDDIAIPEPRRGGTVADPRTVGSPPFSTADK